MHKNSQLCKAWQKREALIGKNQLVHQSGTKLLEDVMPLEREYLQRILKLYFITGYNVQAFWLLNLSKLLFLTWPLYPGDSKSKKLWKLRYSCFWFLWIVRVRMIWQMFQLQFMMKNGRPTFRDYPRLSLMSRYREIAFQKPKCATLAHRELTG